MEPLCDGAVGPEGDLGDLGEVGGVEEDELGCNSIFNRHLQGDPEGLRPGLG